MDSLLTDERFYMGKYKYVGSRDARGSVRHCVQPLASYLPVEKHQLVSKAIKQLLGLIFLFVSHSLSDAAVFLMDMFPHLTRLQVDNSLFVTKGDIEQATQILLTESNSTDCSSEGCNGNTLYSTSASSIQVC